MRVTFGEGRGDATGEAGWLAAGAGEATTPGGDAGATEGVAAVCVLLTCACAMNAVVSKSPVGKRSVKSNE